MFTVNSDVPIPIIARLILAFFIFALVFNVSCAKTPDSSSFCPSRTLPLYNQTNFITYISETKKWIKENRAFLTYDHELEIRLNAPYELKPPRTNGVKKGVLFVHGLGASPWYFMDIGKELVKNGWLVRTILLPGHGSKPADLMLPDYTDWEKALEHHAGLLSNEVDELWLAGFSTGGNLVTAYALDNDDISGLLLFSPGFYPQNSLLWFSSLISCFRNWIDIDKEDNILCYQSLSANAAKLYYQSVKILQKKLDAQSFNKPTLIVMSQHDSVLNPYATLYAFQSKFTHSASRFIWYGSGEISKNKDIRVSIYNSRLPHEKISTFSHMNVIFSENNEYFGKNGRNLMLENGQENIPIPKERSELWFSAWGYKEKGKYHARITWNPYFMELISAINEIAKND